MKRVLLALALMMLLSMLASAGNDSVTTGPYRISFNLGFSNSSYKIDIQEPIPKEELSGDKSVEYNVIITNMTGLNRKATITLKTHGQDQVIPTAEEIRSQLSTVFSFMGNACDTDSAVREIDGSKGGIISAKVCGKPDEGLCMIEWYPDHKSHFTIISTYPWDEGTLQLLKTIHIEKIAGKS